MDLFARVSQLSVAEKLQLVESLWDQIGSSTKSLPSPNWHKEELDRRRSSYQANPGCGITWDDAKMQIRRGLE
jgi:putative addiction module component (TIGR02574 family)